VWMRGDVHDAALEGLAPALTAAGATSVVSKRLEKDVHGNTARRLSGADPGEVVVWDDDARISTTPHARLQTGLFLDLRPARRWVRRHAAGARVLNLFAYTGAFSVHAGLGGAERITTVDASRRALRTGRHNFALNALDADRHRWFCDDALSVLRRAGPQSYELILLDPPAFGRAGNKRFSLRLRFDELVDAGLHATTPGGRLLIATHDPDLDLDRRVARGLERWPGHRIVWRFDPDPDFPGLRRVRRSEVNVALDATVIEAPP